MITSGTPLTALQQRVIGWINERWMAGLGFPSDNLVYKRFPEFDLKESLQHDIFLKALHNRGIILPSVHDELTNEQLAAISVVCNFADQRSRSAKLRSLGITATKWQGWMKNKSFKKYLHDLSATNFQDNVHVAHEGLLKAVDRGSVDAIRFYLESTGRYTQSSAESQNIKIILARVIESIQKHVKDPNVLRAIAQDFELIMAGKAPISVDIEAIESREPSI